MSDLLAKGAAWLSRKMSSHAAQVVTYQRGTSSASVRATIGRSEFDIADGNGFLTRAETRDYIIQVPDLELDDFLIIPEAGDRIIEGPLDDGLVFEVMPPPGQPAFKYTDGYRTAFRIHTKDVGRQPPAP